MALVLPSQALARCDMEDLATKAFVSQKPVDRVIAIKTPMPVVFPVDGLSVIVQLRVNRIRV